MSLHRISFRLENNLFECFFVVINNKSSCEIWTIGTEMARFLEYEDPQGEIDCLSYDFKKSWCELQIYCMDYQCPPICTPLTIFISKNGIYHLLRPSKRRALQMGKWLYNEIYPHFYKSCPNNDSNMLLTQTFLSDNYNNATIVNENATLKKLISQILLPDAPDVVCYEYSDSIYDGKYYRIVSEKILSENPILERAMTRNLQKRIRAHENGAIEVARLRVPVTLEFWERAKTMFPCTFYGMLLSKTNHHDVIINFMPEQTIRERYRKQMHSTSAPQTDFIDEDDAVLKTLTPRDNAREKLVCILTAVQSEISKEIFKMI